MLDYQEPLVEKENFCGILSKPISSEKTRKMLISESWEQTLNLLIEVFLCYIIIHSYIIIHIFVCEETYYIFKSSYLIYRCTCKVS